MTYLEESNLVLEVRVRSVGFVGLQREMVEKMSASQVLVCLGDDLAAFHVLPVPE